MRYGASCIAVAIAASALLGGCTRQKVTESLEDVAKNWCLTIRASQVLPVYPLTEDLQPGDVFLVPLPLSRQTDLYDERGFLPLDQLVTRLPVAEEATGDDRRLDYATFYRPGYWEATYGQNPDGEPRPTETGHLVPAPRAAFPSYTFGVDQGGGLKLAIPISSVPVGLGVMGASKANGTVTISDAYTYGIDIATLYEEFLAWYASNGEIRDTLRDVVQSVNDEVYLRVVNRVYLTKGVTVTLSNLETSSFGLDVGVPQEVALPDITNIDPEQAEASAEAYRTLFQALADPLGAMGPEGLPLPGGSGRFTQANQLSVTMTEPFDRPLVIGYLGFDVRLFPNGSLSPPIPSFSVINDRTSTAESFQSIDWPVQRQELIRAVRTHFLANQDDALAWLDDQPNAPSPSDFLHQDEHVGLLHAYAEHFGITVN